MSKNLKELLKEYNELDDEQKIVTLQDVNNMLNRIVDLTNSLKELIGNQLDELEEIDDCNDDRCDCDESPLYEIYIKLYDAIIEDNIYKAIYILNSNGTPKIESESCNCEVSQEKKEIKKLKRIIKK